MLGLGDRVAPALGVLGQDRGAEQREAFAELVVELGRLLGRGVRVRRPGERELGAGEARVGEGRLRVDLDGLLQLGLGLGVLPHGDERLTARDVRDRAAGTRGHRLVGRRERPRAVLGPHLGAGQRGESGRRGAGLHGPLAIAMASAALPRRSVKLATAARMSAPAGPLADAFAWSYAAAAASRLPTRSWSRASATWPSAPASAAALVSVFTASSGLPFSSCSSAFAMAWSSFDWAAAGAARKATAASAARTLFMAALRLR